MGIGISGEQGNRDSEVQIELGAKFAIEIHLAVDIPMKAADCCIYIKSSMGEIISCLWCSDTTEGLSIEPGTQIIIVCAQNLFLTPGSYIVEIHLNPIIGDDPCDVIDLISSYDFVLKHLKERPDSISCTTWLSAD